MILKTSQTKASYLTTQGSLEVKQLIQIPDFMLFLRSKKYLHVR